MMRTGSEIIRMCYKIVRMGSKIMSVVSNDENRLRDYKNVL